jgi:hypothetical protein
LLLAAGLFSPVVNDVLRVAILLLGIVNIVVLLVVVRTLRGNARLLLDMEQFAREARQAARRLQGEVGPRSVL